MPTLQRTVSTFAGRTVDLDHTVALPLLRDLGNDIARALKTALDRL